MQWQGRNGFWVTAVVFAGLCQGALAQSAPPDSDNGRYSFSKTDDGFLRLDTRTGAVSNCVNNNGWVCRLIPDERAAFDDEIGRLQHENASLKARLAALGAGTPSGKTSEALPKGDLETHETDSGRQASAENKPAPGGKESDHAKGKDTVIELRLPPQEQVIAAIDRIWQHLVGLAGRVQKKFQDSI